MGVVVIVVEFWECIDTRFSVDRVPRHMDILILVGGRGGGVGELTPGSLWTGYLDRHIVI